MRKLTYHLSLIGCIAIQSAALIAAPTSEQSNSGPSYPKTDKTQASTTPATDNGTLYVFEAKDYSHLLGMPGFSNNALNMHFTLYKGYVKNANLLLSTLQQLGEQGKGKTPEYAELKRRLGWEFDGMRLHELYFDNLGGTTPLSTSSKLYQKLQQSFGSYDQWKEDFVDTGLMRGIGWAVLYQDPVSGSLVNMWINEHDVGHLAGGKPILIMDVFEHAYLPDYQLERAKYIDAFFKNINWEVVNDRYQSAINSSTSTPKQ